MSNHNFNQTNASCWVYVQHSIHYRCFFCHRLVLQWCK